MIDNFDDWEIVKVPDLRDRWSLEHSLYVIRYMSTSRITATESFTDEAAAIAFVLSKTASMDQCFPLDQLPLVRQSVKEYLDSVGYVSSKRLKLEGVIPSEQKSKNQGAQL